MVSDERDFTLRLPTRWPRWARSAILHALSRARVALLAATDRVAISVRLVHERALLREELRIKDARLERVRPPDALARPRCRGRRIVAERGCPGVDLSAAVSASRWRDLRRCHRECLLPRH